MHRDQLNPGTSPGPTAAFQLTTAHKPNPSASRPCPCPGAGPPSPVLLIPIPSRKPHKSEVRRMRAGSAAAPSPPPAHHTAPPLQQHASSRFLHLNFQLPHSVPGPCSGPILPPCSTASTSNARRCRAPTTRAGHKLLPPPPSPALLLTTQLPLLRMGTTACQVVGVTCKRHLPALPAGNRHATRGAPLRTTNRMPNPLKPYNRATEARHTKSHTGCITMSAGQTTGQTR